jgi:gliding motility-associated-like protein
MNAPKKMKKLLLFLALFTAWFSPGFAQTDFVVSGKRCVNAELTFSDRTTNNPTSWSWDFGDNKTSTLQNPTHAYLDPGNYIITLTSTANGVNTSKSLTITIFSNPVAGFSSDTVLYTSYARLFNDTSVHQFAIINKKWNFANLNTITDTARQIYFKFPAAGTFTVTYTITDLNGCSDSVSHDITTFDRFYVPNVFTPNNDGINDQFIISSNGITRFSIEIFNRWGNRVFQRSNMEQIVWDGFNPEGTLVKPGVYFYVISVDDSVVNYEPQNGFITIFY